MKKEAKTEEKKIEEPINKETPKVEEKSEIKSEEKTKKEEKKQEIVKKEKAVVNGKDLPISKKHSMAICDLIRGKNPEEMIPELELIMKMKKPLKMRGEIPHRHGKIMSGRYPVNASKVFINLLKNLQANSQVNGIENPIITLAIANDASRPFRRGGRERFKRTNVYLEAKERKVSEKKQENKQEAQI
ncbi:hypothetical protein FJZ19_02010 [Candidatus Pacearchaeota archaeon]|nr:hypothetical protein [Candidatus Pacearchaeota archaeon]